MVKLKLLAILGRETGCQQVQDQEASIFLTQGSPFLQEIMMQPHSLQSALDNLAVGEENHPAGVSVLFCCGLGEWSQHPVGGL